MAEDARAKVLALLELALGPGTPPHEAAAAAMAACRRIKSDGLMLGEGFGERFSEESEDGEGYGRYGRRGGVCTICGDSLGSEETVIVRIPFLILTESSKVYRVARLEPPRRSSSHVLLIPKEYVKKVVMMTVEESREIGWKESRIIKSLTLVKSYFDAARQSGWNHWS